MYVVKKVCVLVCLILALSACENPYIQDLLWDSAELENITVTMEDGTNYELNPFFNAAVAEYTVTVPYLTRLVNLTGRPHRDAVVSYMRGDGLASGGVFDFPEEMEEMTIYMRVERKYMDPRTYTLKLKRGADSWLRDLRVQSGISAEAIDPALRPLSPGFTAGRFRYLVKVPSNTQAVKIQGIVKPGITISYSRKDGPQDQITGNFPFALTDDSMEVTIRVADPLQPSDPETNPLEYTLTLRRPGKVIVSAGAAGIKLFSIQGGPYFNIGEPVVVIANPPFGTFISTTNYTPAGGKPIPLSSATNIYSFIMPDGDVVLDGSYTAVAPVSGVKYVWEHGTGDGSSWINASGNLQAMIESCAPHQEIWVARGTVKPDWSTITPGAGWAEKLDAAQVADKRHWSFVLKDGVKIYGGFKGIEAGSADKKNRDYRANETILSGDWGAEGNVRHVVVAAGISDSSRLEGLTISGGSAFSVDFPIYIRGKPIEQGMGGGIYIIDANPRLNKVIIRNNTAKNGGGLFARNSCSVLTDVTMRSNVVSITGGAMYDDSESKVVVIGGSFKSNQGNAILYTGYNTSLALINVMINGNVGDGLSSREKAFLINVTINGNTGCGATDGYTAYNTVITNNDGMPSQNGAYYHSVVDNVDHPGILNPRPDSPVDQRDNDLYPLTMKGGKAAGSISTSYDSSLAAILTRLFPDSELMEYLAQDAAGRPRIRNSMIDLGALEE